METLGSTDQKPFLTLHHVSRRFGSVLANRDISLNLFEGEIHAIVGENGAGKSTLMKILCGELQPDSGEIRIDGCPTAFRRPQEAIRAGIGMAHQHFLIFPQLTALENIIAGGEPGTWGWLRRRRANEELLALCRSVGFALPLDVPASGLSFAHRQQIEILRLLYRQVKVLVFDEPTSLLAPPETERFLDLLRTLQASGHTVLFISHRLHEVLTIADRISVLRRGMWAGTFLKSEITVERLVRVVISGSPAPYPGTAPPKEDASAGALHLHTGLLLSKAKPPPAANHDHYATLTPRPPTVPLLQMKDVTTRARAQEAGLDRFSLEVFKGEVFGLGGVVGNGQRTLALLLSGMLPAARGTVVLSGREITSLSVSERLAMGLRWLPANPQEEALLPSRSLWENLLLGRQRQPRLHHHGWLNRRFINHWAAEQLDRNGVVYASLHDPLSSLSGGNSQKLALCRVLEGSPALVILEQPSRGLDIRAQEHLRNQVRELNRQGITIMVISYDLDELLELSHRLGIMYRGRLMGLTAPPEASRERLGSWMLGVETGDFKLKG